MLLPVGVVNPVLGQACSAVPSTRRDARGRHDPLRREPDAADPGRRHVPDEVLTPHPRFALDRWPERLAGRAVEAVDAHGKHLFVRFEGDLVIHSHLRMTGSWGTYAQGRRWRRSPRRAWLVLRARGHEVVQFDGPVLELQTASRARLDQRVAALGPDILAPRLGRGGRAALPAAPARGRPHAPDRRRAARPADDRRHRQPLEGRGVLRGRRRPLAPDGPRQRRGGAAHRGGHAAADAALRARRQPDALQDDLRPPRAARARGAGRRSPSAGRATTTARRSGAPAASDEGPRRASRR